MQHQLKLVVALAAALISLTAFAPTAFAQFTTSSEHTLLKGVQTESHVMTIGSGFGGMTCSTATFSGTVPSKSESTWTLQPTWAGCSSSFGPVDILKNNLEYHFLSGASKGSYTLTGEIVTTITTGTHCTITIKGDQTANGLTYINLGGTKGIELSTSTSNIAATVEGGFFTCGTSTTNISSWTYSGKSVYTGTDTVGKAVELRVD